MYYNETIVNKVSVALIKASSTFSAEKKDAYKEAIKTETNDNAKWAMEKMLENALAAEKNSSPLCDDTGIPHLILEVGPEMVITGNMIESIKEGIRQGLRKLPGRPMAVAGNDRQRIDQSLGIEEDSAAVETAPILFRNTEENIIRLHILMLGGGPAIRGKTYRVFHKHNIQNVLDEIVCWATEASKMLGCTPCTLAVGIGRTHYEAASLMLQALVDRTYYEQTEMEKEITNRVNAVGTGPLGLGGNRTILATFMKIGPQRASGIRVVSMRPCCCCEPRIASVEL